MEIKKLLTINEVATALGLGRSLVYQLVSDSQIASITIGRARRVPVGALDDFIAKRLEEQSKDTEVQR